jgi:thiamine-phosphate pyrophosphorylase
MTHQPAIDTGRAERQRRFAEIDLYPVTCESLSAGRTDTAVLAAVLAGGARIIQLRDKQASKRQLYAKALAFRAATAAAGALLIINDHLDIALAVGADGVHLGQDDLPLAAARALAPGLLLGISCHSAAHALEAQAGGADYVNLGPIYATATKGGLSHFLGPDFIRQVAPQLTVPFTIMGGIKLDNLPQVLAAGASRIAVVTAITEAPDMVATTRAWRAQINAARGRSPACNCA